VKVQAVFIISDRLIVIPTTDDILPKCLVPISLFARKVHTILILVMKKMVKSDSNE